MSERQLDSLIRRIHPQWRLLRAQPMTGGVSAQVMALDVADEAGHMRRLVVRAHGLADVAANPHVAEDEYHLLAFLHAAGLAVPAPVAWGEIEPGRPSPYVIVARLDGAPDPAPTDPITAARATATFLTQLHTIAPTDARLLRLPNVRAQVAHRLAHPPATLDTTLREDEVRAALQAAGSLPAYGGHAVLHGDFWPGNCLWNDGRLVGVIDWEDAVLGDPLADVGNARLELLWAWGEGAMDAFTAHYAAMSACDMARLPYWDLCAALRPAGKLSSWGLAPAAVQAMRDKHHRFVTQALARMDAGPH